MSLKEIILSSKPLNVPYMVSANRLLMLPARLHTNFSRPAACIVGEKWQTVTELQVYQTCCSEKLTRFHWERWLGESPRELISGLEIAHTMFITLAIYCLSYLFWLRTKHKSLTSQIASLCGQHGALLGPGSPRWAPRWPHESCYQGLYGWCFCGVASYWQFHCTASQ